MNTSNFEHIYISYFKVLSLFALRIVRDSAVAEDIVQDVFTECWDNRDVIDFKQPIKPYLYKLTYNRSLDFLKSSNSKNVLISEKTSILNDILYAAFTTEEEVRLGDIRRELLGGIDTLPERCKEVFLLSRKSNLKNKEIAKSLDISVKAVEKHITTALKSLRSHLIKAGYLTCLIIVVYFLKHFS